VNYKRKSRRQFFLLMRSRTPPISSDFRGGGGVNPPNPPPLGTPLAAPYKWLYILNIVTVWNACGQTCHKNIRSEPNTCNHFPLKTSAEITCIRVDSLSPELDPATTGRDLFTASPADKMCTHALRLTGLT